MSDRVTRIRALLEARFAPERLEIHDDSAAHAGHAGAASGAGHYRVVIRAAAFAGIAPVQRHRLVYAAVGEMMGSDIHALSIDAAES